MRTVPSINRQWRLVKRPAGSFQDTDFSLVSTPRPTLKESEVLVRVIYLSLDPTNRVWARQHDSYLPSVGIGEVMRGLALGRVVESRNAAFPVDAIVSGVLAWEDYAISDGTWLKVVKQDSRIPLVARFALFEHIGSPAYFGLKDIGRIKAGDQVVVTAAAGAVGSLAVQMAKNWGAHVVGIAGSDEKCAWLKRELGADSAVNYRRGPLKDSLHAACPDGIDLFFDNVGGEGLEAALDLINLHARIVICGAIGGYEADGAQPGPRNLLNLVFKRARMEGFVCFDYAADHAAWAQFEADTTAWHLAGKLNYRVDLVAGLEHAPAAVNRLFTGANQGKLIVQVSAE